MTFQKYKHERVSFGDSVGATSGLPLETMILFIAMFAPGFLVAFKLFKASGVTGWLPLLLSAVAGLTSRFIIPVLIATGQNMNLVLKNKLLGGPAAAWTLTEDVPVLKRINWLYLRSKLSKREMEAARILALNFTGDLKELVTVSRAVS